MADAFADPKRRLARAKHHLADFEAKARAFVESKPYRTVVESHLNGTKDIYKIVLAQPVPGELTDLVVEMTEHLRAALDLAGYAAAVAGGKTSPKNAYFPIADSAEALERDVIRRGRCKDLPPDILTLFRSFKPYDGDNIPVWLINKLGNTSKHRFLAAAAMAADGVDLGFLIATSGDTELPAAFQWDSTKNEMVVGVAPAGAKLHYDIKFFFFIAFGPIEPVEGQPVIPIFRGFIGEVERIVLATEAECRRIGLIP